MQSAILTTFASLAALTLTSAQIATPGIAPQGAATPLAAPRVHRAAPGITARNMFPGPGAAAARHGMSLMGEDFACALMSLRCNKYLGSCGQSESVCTPMQIRPRSQTPLPTARTRYGPLELHPPLRLSSLLSKRDVAHLGAGPLRPWFLDRNCPHPEPTDRGTFMAMVPQTYPLSDDLQTIGPFKSMDSQPGPTTTCYLQQCARGILSRGRGWTRHFQSWLRPNQLRNRI